MKSLADVLTWRQGFQSVNGPGIKANECTFGFGYGCLHKRLASLATLYGVVAHASISAHRDHLCR